VVPRPHDLGAQEGRRDHGLTDVVIEVLDARLPEASSNPMIRELRLFRQRPCLKLLNKADLADPEATRPGWISTTPAGRQGGGHLLQETRATRRASRPVQDPGAASQRRHQAAAHADHGHPQRRQIDPDERPAQAPRRRRRRRAGGDQVADAQDLGAP
jgi:hypothetical protein